MPIAVSDLAILTENSTDKVAMDEKINAITAVIKDFYLAYTAVACLLKEGLTDMWQRALLQRPTELALATKEVLSIMAFKEPATYAEELMGCFNTKGYIAADGDLALLKQCLDPANFTETRAHPTIKTQLIREARSLILGNSVEAPPIGSWLLNAAAQTKIKNILTPPVVVFRESPTTPLLASAVEPSFSSLDSDDEELVGGCCPCFRF